MEPSKIIPITNTSQVVGSTMTNTNTTNNNIPEYALLELNGELYAPHSKNCGNYRTHCKMSM
jgi:hypothetical protein